MSSSIALADICSLVSNKIDVEVAEAGNYVSTENMVTNRGGVRKASSIPISGSVTGYKCGDVLVSNIRPYFKKIWLANRDGGASNDVLVFRPNLDIVDGRYFYYLLASDKFFAYAMASAKGAKMPRGDKAQIIKYPVDLPDMATQRKIADILGSLDDKIELNRQMNETLEQIGQALFRHYFIDNPDAKNWPKRKLGEFFEVKTGKKDANYATADGKYPFFTCSQKSLMSPEYSFDGNAILLAGNGDFNIKTYKGKFEAYQRTYVLMPHEENLVGLLYFLMKKYLPEITGGSRGSVIKFITKGMIENFSIPLPDDGAMGDYGKCLDDILEVVACHTKQNSDLIAMRDALLTKLI